MTKPCTIIGARGYVGRKLHQSLVEQGFQVYAPDKNDPALFERDLGQVFYCAGLTADYLQRPFDTVEAHVSLLARLLAKARFERLVYLSSTRLYDSQPGDLADEASPLLVSPSNPRHLYDLSKALGENLCLTIAGQRTAIARLACVYDESPDAEGFLSTTLARARQAKSFTLDSNSTAVRDYIHLDDVVASLQAILFQDGQGIFNVASGVNVSNAELAQIFAQSGWELSFQHKQPLTPPPTCSIDHLRALGLSPRPVGDVIPGILTRWTQQ